MRLYLWRTIIDVVDVVRVCRKENRFSHRNRTECLWLVLASTWASWSEANTHVLVSWEHRRHRGRSLSCAWRARCMWQHHEWHPRGKSSERHAFPRKSLQDWVNEMRWTQDWERTSWDTFDSTAASKTADGGLSYALDVVSKNLSVALGSTLSKTLSTFATCRRRVSGISTSWNCDSCRGRGVGGGVDDLLTSSHVDRGEIVSW